MLSLCGWRLDSCVVTWELEAGERDNANCFNEIHQKFVLTHEALKAFIIVTFEKSTV